MSGSIFQKIIRREIPAYIVQESDKFIAFLDAFPLQRGHTLIVPKVEVDYIFDLEDKYLGEMMIFAKEVAQKIKRVIPCDRVGVAVIGLEVPHAHIHLVPINQMKDIDFQAKKLQLSKEEMQHICEQLRGELK